MISNPCVEVYTSSVDRPSVPPWLAEGVIVVQHLATRSLLDAFAHQVRFVRGRFGTYEPIDFLALPIGYAISGERTLADFFERVEHARDCIHGLVWTPMSPSSCQRSVASSPMWIVPARDPFRTLFEQQRFAQGWTSETIGGIFDRQNRRYLVFDVDATRQAAAPSSVAL